MAGNESITTVGVTVQDAVDKALKALNITGDQADIEIIQEGKQGFMGVGAQQAKVRVHLKEGARAERDLSDLLIDLDMAPAQVDVTMGRVAYRDGRVVVKNPTTSTKYATIKPGNNVKILINGKAIAAESPVTEEDEVIVELCHEEPESSLILQLSDDETEAYLKWVAKSGVRYNIPDCPDANSLELLAEVAETLEPAPFSGDAIRKYLQEQGVVKGVMDDTLQEVCKTPNPEEGVLVAKGEKPIDGVDAVIRLPYKEEADASGDEGLFGHHKLISVRPGDVVAMKVPGMAGTDGWAVTGEVLGAKAPADYQIVIKSGCELAKNGEQAVATIPGRPVVESSGQTTSVSVDPIYEVKDVDNSTGDIVFAGDVEIKGSVREGFKVEAQGNIEVFGDVTRCSLHAGGSVIVHKMVLASSIVAGGRAALYSSLAPYLQEISEMLEKVYTVAHQLKNSPAFSTSDLKAKGDGPLIQLILDSKVRELPKHVNEVAEMVFKDSKVVHEELLKLTRALHSSLCALGPLRLESLEILPALRSEVGQVSELIKGSMAREVCLKLNYVQNSTLLSSGDVVIEGQGGYISTITAGRDVSVSGNPGIARGVKIVSGGNVNIKELGSEFDTQTFVHIKGKGCLSADLVHPNVVIQIGAEKIRVDRAYKNVEAYMSPAGLAFDKLTAD